MIVETSRAHWTEWPPTVEPPNGCLYVLEFSLGVGR